MPWVNALVVLHGQGSTFSVDPSGRAGVIKLDGYEVASNPPLQRLSEFLATPPGNPRDSIDPQRANVVRRLCEKADFRPTPKTRMVGDYAIAEADPVAEGADWQDVVVTHPTLPRIKQRLRLYDVPPKASASGRKRIEQLAQRELQLTYGKRQPRARLADVGSELDPTYDILARLLIGQTRIEMRREETVLAKSALHWRIAP